jgi:hypothetical protein
MGRTTKDPTTRRMRVLRGVPAGVELPSTGSSSVRAKPAVLVVFGSDLDEERRFALTAALQHGGLRPICATTTDDAVALLGALAVDAVVAAHGHTDGLGLLGRMRAEPRWASIPALIVSDEVDRRGIERAALLTGAGFVSDGSSAEAILGAVVGALRSQPARTR